MALSYTSRTGATGLGPFTFTFPITNPLLSPPATDPGNQVRVFKKVVAGTVTELFPAGRLGPSGVVDWTMSADNTSITLASPLITTDTLVIMRDTRMNRPYVEVIPASRFRATDRNARGDQILFVAQELREIREIADIFGSGAGQPFEYTPGAINDSVFSKSYTGNGVTVTFSYAGIDMFPRGTVPHITQLVATVNGTPVTIASVSESAQTVTLSAAPGNGTAVKIKRSTKIDKRWVPHTDATTFSSMLANWDYLNLKFLVEETQGFPSFIKVNALQNRVFPRPINTITYSGPGDRFFFGNLAWFGDGVVTVTINDVVLEEHSGYEQDFLSWLINLLVSLAIGDLITISTTNPNHAFHGIPFLLPLGVDPTADPSFTPPAGSDHLIVVPVSTGKYVTSAGALKNQTQFDIGDLTEFPISRGGVLLVKTPTIPALPGATIHRALLVITNVEAWSLLLSKKVEIERLTADYGNDPVTDTYAGLSALFDATVAQRFLPPGLGAITVDVTEMVQKAATANANRVFFALREEPFPPTEASSGVVETNGFAELDLVLTLSTKTNVSPTEDTGPSAGSPDTPNSSNVTILVRLETIGSPFANTALFEFDLTTIDVASFAQVKLKIKYSGTQPGTYILSLRRCLRAAVMAQATWNSFATGQLWGTPGARNSTTDYHGATAVPWTIPSPFSGFQQSPDIKQIALDAKNLQGGILRLLLACTSSASPTSTATSLVSQNGAVPSDRPLLEFL